MSMDAVVRMTLGGCWTSNGCLLRAPLHRARSEIFAHLVYIVGLRNYIVELQKRVETYLLIKDGGHIQVSEAIDFLLYLLNYP